MNKVQEICTVERAVYKTQSFTRSLSRWLQKKSYGALSIKPISAIDFFMMVVRFPQEKTAAKNPAISISCCRVTLWGMETGSFSNKGGLVIQFHSLVQKVF